MLRPVESAAGRGFAPGPSPALACRKTPHFAGPRPQSARHEYRQCCASVFPRFQQLWYACIHRLHALPLWTKKLSTSAALPWATPLSSLPCWVVPPPKTRQSVEPPASSSSSPLRSTASPCLSLPAIPPHLRRGEPRRKCSGRAGGSRLQLFNCFRLLAQRMSGGAFGGLWPPRLIALSAHNHAFASARHPLRRWEPFSLGFAHGRYPFDSALSRARWARTPEAVCAHILPVFAGGREPRVSRPLYRQSPPSLTRRCYRPPPGPRSTRFARSAPLVV